MAAEAEEAEAAAEAAVAVEDDLKNKGAVFRVLIM